MPYGHPRYQEPPVDPLTQLRSLIIHFGETGGPPEEIRNLSSTLKNEFHHNEYSKQICDVLVECAANMPSKSALYGTVIGLLNVECYESIGDLVAQVHRSLENAIATGEQLQMRLLTRFLAVLVNNSVLLPSSLLSCYSTLVGAAKRALEEGTEKARKFGETLLHCVLGSMTWIGGELAESLVAELEEVLQRVEVPDSATAGHSVLALDSAPPSFLGSMKAELLNLVKAFKDDGVAWEIPCIPVTHLTFEATLALAKQHPFPEVHVEPPYERTGADEVKVKEFSYAQVIILVPNMTGSKQIVPIDRLLLVELFVDITEAYNGARKDCYNELSSIVIENTPRIFLLAETLFLQMLYLPTPPNLQVAYAVLFVDLCKGVGGFPRALHQNCTALCQALDAMDIECQDRLVDWLGHHISSLGFGWVWEDYNDLPEAATEHKLRIFVQDLLERLMRLSYFDKVEQEVPAELGPLMPAAPSPTFKFGGGQSGEGDTSEFVQELIRLVKSKALWSSVKEFIDTKVTASMSNKEAIELVMQTFLHLGSKTYSHLETVLTRYLKVIESMLTEDDSQLNVLLAVQDFWSNSSQHRSYVMGKLMTYRIVANTDIADWVLSDPGLRQCHRFHSWEVLKEVSAKVLAKKNDLEDLFRESLARNDGKEEERRTAVEEAEEDARKFSLHVLRLFLNRIASPPPDQCAISDEAFKDTLRRRLRAFCRMHSVDLLSQREQVLGMLKDGSDDVAQRCAKEGLGVVDDE